MEVPYSSEIITGLIGTASSIIVWLSARKKNRLDLENQESINLRENLKIYQELIDDLKKRFDAEISALNSKLDIVRRDLDDCRKRHANET